MAPCPQCSAPCSEGASKCLACGAALAAGVLHTEDTFKGGSGKTPQDTLLVGGAPAPPGRTDESAVRTTPHQHRLAESVEASPDAPDPLIGQTPLGQYRIVRKIGEGGFGAVYVAEQVGVTRKAVIKVLRKRHQQSDQFIRRFEREAAVLAALDHHNLVRLYNFGELADGQLFLAMEYGGDRTVAQEIVHHGRLNPERALRIAGQVCDALGEAHERGIVHRDLKPHNLLLGEKGGADWVKVVDVGIAKILDTAGPDLSDSTLTAQGAMIGTPAYLSPEQARGLPVDARSDLYALGVVLYEMITATLPIQGATPLDFVRAHASDPPRAIKDSGVQVPSFVEAVVSTALEKDPARRFASAREMGEAIADARKRLRRYRPRKRYLLLAAAVGAVSGIALLVLLDLRKRMAVASAPATGIAIEKAAAQTVPPAGTPAAAPPEPPAAGATLSASPTAVAALSAPPAAIAAPPPSTEPPPTNAPRDQKALRLIAQATRRSTSPEVAVDKLEQALDLEPSDPVRGKALWALGNVHESIGHPAEALRYYQLCVTSCSAAQKVQLERKIAKLKDELYGKLP